MSSNHLLLIFILNNFDFPFETKTQYCNISTCKTCDWCIWTAVCKKLAVWSTIEACKPDTASLCDLWTSPMPWTAFMRYGSVHKTHVSISFALPSNEKQKIPQFTPETTYNFYLCTKKKKSIENGKLFFNMGSYSQSINGQLFKE